MTRYAKHLAEAISAGLNKCGARLEAHFRGPIQWHVQKLLRKNEALKSIANLRVSGGVPLGFTSPTDFPCPPDWKQSAEGRPWRPWPYGYAYAANSNSSLRRSGAFNLHPYSHADKLPPFIFLLIPRLYVFAIRCVVRYCVAVQALIQQKTWVQMIKRNTAVFSKAKGTV